MNVSESIRMSLRSLGSNKLRAGLTMLGIVIGTGAVIGLLSAGQGAQNAIMEQIQSIGSNLIFVFAGQMQQSSGGTTVRLAAPLTRQDAATIADPGRTQYVAAVAPEIDRSVTVTFKGDSVSSTLVGTNAEYETVRNYRTQIGEFFTPGDESAAAAVAVIGSSIANDLFGDPELALDETIRLNRVPFKVIGVLEEKGGQSAFSGGSRDAVVIIPLTTAQRRLFSGRSASTQGERVDIINVSATDETSIDAAMDEITWLLRERRKIKFEEDDFTVASQKDVLGVLSQITDVLKIFLGAIAGISLLVGGIGIMNIMLVSVTERTREIGIRKAIGAKRSDILWQFLVESVVMSVIGGLVGILFGWGVAALVNALGSFKTSVSVQSVVLAVGFSVAVGLFFGIYPASRASNLHPIEALRYE